MNARKKNLMLHMGFIVMKLNEFCEEINSKTLRMARNGAKAFFDAEVAKMTFDEKLKLRTDMERKVIQIDTRKNLDFQDKLYGDQMVVGWNEIRTLCSYSMDYACRFCNRDHEEQKNCMLREAFIRANAVGDVDLSRTDHCPFLGCGATAFMSAADERLHNKWGEANKGGKRR